MLPVLNLHLIFLSLHLSLLSLKHLSRPTVWLEVEKKKWVRALSLIKELFVYVKDQLSPLQNPCKNTYRALENSFYTGQTYNVIPKVKCILPAAVGSSSSSLSCDSLQRLVYHRFQSQVYRHVSFFHKTGYGQRIGKQCCQENAKRRQETNESKTLHF